MGPSSSGVNAAPVFNGSGLARVEEGGGGGGGRGSSDRWVFAPRAPDKRASGSSCRKSGELISLLEQEEVSRGANNQTKIRNRHRMFISGSRSYDQGPKKEKGGRQQ